MPAEERKFKRLRMVAFFPVCRRERAEAASHADATGVTAVGVEVEDVAAVADGDGRGVAVGSGRLVSVGEARGVWVDTAAHVSVGEESGVRVNSDAMVGV
jgi:hypothetical protein